MFVSLYDSMMVNLSVTLPMSVIMDSIWTNITMRVNDKVMFSKASILWSKLAHNSSFV